MNLGHKGMTKLRPRTNTAQQPRVKITALSKTSRKRNSSPAKADVTMMLDQEEVLMRTGDFAVERGTNHAWANRSDKPCRLLFVLIDGQFEPELAKRFPAPT